MPAPGDLLGKVDQLRWIRYRIFIQSRENGRVRAQNLSLIHIYLGLGYLALDRAAATLSTGERQRMQLAREMCIRDR